MTSPSTRRKPRRRGHYVLSTHWDREWYQTFQEYRHRLVKLLDRVLDRIADGSLQGPFTCDGQSIIIEDYLEIRPEREEQVRQYLAGGKLIAGPWYVLPDEFLVSGESLIRNIRHGGEVARSFGGKPSRAGFVCDLFGHCSQLPQIFRQFGIKAAIVWRGIEPLPDARFLWAGADGEVIPAIRFGKGGYCDYAFKVRHSPTPDIEFDEAKAKADLQKFLDEESARTGGEGAFLIFDGGDHLEPDPDHYKVLLSQAENPDRSCDIVHTDLDTFLGELLKTWGNVTHTVRGELREPGGTRFEEDQNWLIPGTGSSRVWIKQANAACQNLLCQWAEPFNLLAHILTGSEWPETYLRRSWTWLLQNHPHDSICGCSIDQVHEDMKYRFAQSHQIAAQITGEALTAITANVAGGLGERELRLGVFNPAPHPRDEVVELTLDIPKDWPEFTEFFGFENKPAFTLFDENGHEIPYQRLSQKRDQTRKRIRDIKFPEGYQVTEVKVAARLKLPAIGYTTLRIAGDRRTDENAKLPMHVRATRYPAAPGLAISDRALENEFLRVTVESNGSLNLLNRKTGETFERLLTFEDQADIGDGWYHGPPVNDQIFTSAAAAADVAIVANGPQLATLRVRTTLRLPVAFDFAKMTRAGQFTELVIDSLITLRTGQNLLDVVSTVNNTIRDHRLRVLFPSGATAATTFLADAPFDVVERPIALSPENHLKRELEVEARPQLSWTAVFDTKRGLAIVSDGGLLEAGVRDMPERPVLLTLYRSTTRTVLTSGEPNGELPGHEMTFKFRIVPLGGKPRVRELFDRSQELSGSIKTIHLTAKQIQLLSLKKELPPSGSLLAVKGDSVLTSVRKAGTRIEARLFNPTEKSGETSLSFGQGLPASDFRKVDLNSCPAASPFQIRTKGNSVSFKLKPKELLTLSIKAD